MAGQTLVDALTELGYPQSKNLSPNMFNWMFEDEAISSFLRRFSSSIGKDNVLSQEELKEFEELKDSGTVILEGDVLKDALHKFSNQDEQTQSIEELSDQTTTLAEQVEKYDNKKQLLISRRDKLSSHLNKRALRLSHMSGLESQVKYDHEKARGKLDANNNEMNDSLDGLVHSVARTHSLYERHTEDRTRAEQHFLSRTSLEDYYNIEDLFSHQLLMFTKKRFFDGVVELAGQNEVTRYDLLEVTNPECLVMHGEKQEVILQDMKELARLKKVYPISQLDLIQATVREKQADIAVSHTRELLDRLKKGTFPQTIDRLNEFFAKNQTSLNAVRQDLLQLEQVDIPALISRLADLQGTSLITGNYELKLARQQYFTSNQDQLIEQLVIQRARNEILTMALEVEGRNHRDMNHLLTAMTNTLQQHLSGLQDRMVAMADPSLTARQERATVDTRDKSTARLHQLLTCEDLTEPQLFLTYTGMIEGAVLLRKKHVAVRIALEAAVERHQQKAHVLERQLTMCVSQLYAGSSTIRGEPTFTPPLIKETMLQLENVISKLKTAVSEIMDEHNSKKKSLRTNPLRSKEMELFSYFFTRPEKLRGVMTDMNDRRKAQQLS